MSLSDGAARDVTRVGIKRASCCRRPSSPSRNYSTVYILHITQQFFTYKCLKLNHKILKWVATHWQVEYESLVALTCPH